MKIKSLSIFFPAYNDEHTIGNLARDALKVGEEIASDYEVIIINDGSRDNTGRILDGLARENDRIKVIHHSQNLGYGAALKSGFNIAEKEWIFYTDGDGQYDVKELKKLIPFTDRSDVINGYKRRRSDPVLRKIIGRVYHWSCCFLFNIKIKDVDCDFRLLKNSFIKRVHLVSDGGTICVEMVRKLQDIGARFYEVPVSHYARVHGRSQFFAGIHISVGLKEIVKLWIKLFLLRER